MSSPICCSPHQPLLPASQVFHSLTWPVLPPQPWSWKQPLGTHKRPLFPPFRPLSLPPSAADTHLPSFSAGGAGLLPLPRGLLLGGWGVSLSGCRCCDGGGAGGAGLEGAASSRGGSWTLVTCWGKARRREHLYRLFAGPRDQGKPSRPPMCDQPRS